MCVSLWSLPTLSRAGRQSQSPRSQRTSSKVDVSNRSSWENELVCEVVSGGSTRCQSVGGSALSIALRVQACHVFVEGKAVLSICVISGRGRAEAI